MGERENSKRDEMQPGQDLRKPFIIAGESPKAGKPGSAVYGNSISSTTWINGKIATTQRTFNFNEDE